MSKQKKLCNLILIDESGSMYNRKTDVIGGLQSLFSDIENTKNVFQHTIVCSFSNDFKILTNTVGKLNTDVVEKYSPNGGTALFDAIQKAFSLVPTGFDGVYVNILTDGEENASKTVKFADVKKLISEAKENKWGVTFSGCDENALETAKSLGIMNLDSFTNDAKGFSGMSLNRTRSRTSYFASVETGDIQTEGLFNTTTNVSNKG